MRALFHLFSATKALRNRALPSRAKHTDGASSINQSVSQSMGLSHGHYETSSLDFDQKRRLLLKTSLGSCGCVGPSHSLETSPPLPCDRKEPAIHTTTPTSNRSHSQHPSTPLGTPNAKQQIGQKKRRTTSGLLPLLLVQKLCVAPILLYFRRLFVHVAVRANEALDSTRPCPTGATANGSPIRPVSRRWEEEQ